MPYRTPRHVLRRRRRYVKAHADADKMICALLSVVGLRERRWRDIIATPYAIQYYMPVVTRYFADSAITLFSILMGAIDIAMPMLTHYSLLRGVTADSLLRYGYAYAAAAYCFDIALLLRCHAITMILRHFATPLIRCYAAITPLVIA